MRAVRGNARSSKSPTTAGGGLQACDNLQDGHEFRCPTLPLLSGTRQEVLCSVLWCFQSRHLKLYHRPQLAGD